jgi:hypothetical protein
MEITEDSLDPFQFDSRKGLSTVTALAELVHGWLNALESPGKVVRILLLDFRKAFDKVDHNILLDKLRTSEIPTFLLDWIRSFLCERKQRVKVGTAKSSWSNMKAGVPQGTLLGPVFFLVHVNDLQTACRTVKYVDDTTVWEACSSHGNDSTLQSAAEQVESWATLNNMELNAEKTKELIISFGRKAPDMPAVTINNTSIERVSSSKLLGLILNNKLTWEDQIEHMCAKASQRMYFLVLLKRAGRPPDDILDVYKSIIRSMLEYACEIWHPSLTKQQSNMLEHLQKRALKIVCPAMSYHEALEAFKLMTLFDRREKRCGDFFKTIEDPSHKLHYLLPPLNNSTKNLRNKRQYTLPNIRTSRLRKSPINYLLYK